MPWTNAWDETKPADTDLANTLGTQGRQVKLDIRERLDSQHIFGHSTTTDGEHRNIVISSNGITANQEAIKVSSFSLTGANAQSLMDWSGTWNTSGTPTAVKVTITNTASNAASKLLDFIVGVTSIFSIRVDGLVAMLGAVLSRPKLLYYTEALNSVGNISGATAIDASLGHYSASLTGNVTFSVSNIPATGQAWSILLYLKQGGVGSFTVTWPGAVVWQGGTAPTLTTTAGKTDIIVLNSIDGGTTIRGNVYGQNWA